MNYQISLLLSFSIKVFYSYSILIKLSFSYLILDKNGIPLQLDFLLDQHHIDFAYPLFPIVTLTLDLVALPQRYQFLLLDFSCLLVQD